MTIEIKLHKERKIQARELKRLYEDMGWWPERTIVDIEKMLNIGPAIGVWKDSRLVGFCRAISDGVFRAYIEDVAVIEEHRKLGIGNRMVKELMKELSDISVVSLFCEEALVDFYKKDRFKETTQIVMHRKTKYRQQ
ncbi:GNAT family N-acetyltransferase [Paenibacillus illinoisensis]|uniref:GNAT family N-acetyltransferase n=1 Tax=Paenibacillus illinoisensis TaxID=59845 RepID=UPI003A4E0220